MSGRAEPAGMDEIRASISRIIADGEEGRGAFVPIEGPSGEEAARSPEPASAAEWPEVVALRPVLPGAPPEPSSRPASAGDADRLVSPAVEGVAAAAFAALGRAGPTPRTLEDVVAEMLRPMLRDWLDQNLPGLVERLVRDEIERISRAR